MKDQIINLLAEMLAKTAAYEKTKDDTQVIIENAINLLRQSAEPDAKLLKVAVAAATGNGVVAEMNRLSDVIIFSNCATASALMLVYPSLLGISSEKELGFTLNAFNNRASLALERQISLEAVS